MMKKNNSNPTFIGYPLAIVLSCCLPTYSATAQTNQADKDYNKWQQGIKDYNERQLTGKNDFDDIEKMQQMSLEERTKQADVVIEGRIVERFFVPTANNMYRIAVKVEVYKLFKGKGVKKHIVVLGNEDYKTDEYEDGQTQNRYFFMKSLKPLLPEDDYYDYYGTTFFFLNKTNCPLKNKQKYPIFQFIGDWTGIKNISWQSVLNNRSTKKVPYAIRIDSVILLNYNKLEHHIGKKYKTIKKRKTYSQLHKSAKTEESSALPIITSVEPHTLSAGHLSLGDNASVLTIHGENFGTTKRQIFLPNADTGGKFSNGDIDFVPIHPQFVTSWTNNQIVVRIPSRGYAQTSQSEQNKIPGSGIVKIIFPEFVATTPSEEEDPIINYSITNYTDNIDYAEIHLYDTDGGGNQSDFTFVYDTAFLTTN